MKAIVNAVLRVPSDLIKTLIKTRVVKSYELVNTDRGGEGKITLHSSAL